MPRFIFEFLIIVMAEQVYVGAVFRRKLYLTGVPLDLGYDDEELFERVQDLALKYGPLE